MAALAFRKLQKRLKYRAEFNAYFKLFFIGAGGIAGKQMKL